MGAQRNAGEDFHVLSVLRLGEVFKDNGEEGPSISRAAFWHPTASTKPQKSGVRQLLSSLSLAPEMPHSRSEPLHYLSKSHGQWSKCCLVPSLDLQGHEPQCLASFPPGAPSTLTTGTLKHCWKHLTCFQVWKYFPKH